MSRKRRTSLKENEKIIGNLRGPNGHRLCRFCGTEVTPPRKTFCSEECIHEYRIRSDIKYLRQAVYLRDCGKCAICGVDTRFIQIELEDAASLAIKQTAKGDDWWLKPVYQDVLVKYQLTVNEAGKSIWAADHVTPVIDGGGECDLSNIRSLCIPCHKEVSSEQAQARRIAKRKARARLNSI